MRVRLLLLAAVVAAGGVIAGAKGITGEPLDPVRNVALPCEAVSHAGPRAAFSEEPRPRRQRVRLRRHGHRVPVAAGPPTACHDYAFVGTMGGGTRIFDITDPAHPTTAGRYTDPGYQNDVVGPRRPARHSASTRSGSAARLELPPREGRRHGGSTQAGIDIVRLGFDPATGATFTTELIDCYLSSLGSAGAHTTTIHPSGQWISVNTSFTGSRSSTSGPAPPTLVQYVPATRRRRRARRLVLARRQDALLGRPRLDADRRRDRRLNGRPPTLRRDHPECGHRRRRAPTARSSSSRTSPTPRRTARSWSSPTRPAAASPRRGCNEGASGKIGAAHFWDIAGPRGAAEARLVAVPEPGAARRPARAGAGGHRAHRARLHHPRLPQRRQRHGRTGPDRRRLRRRLVAAVAAARDRALRCRHLVARLLAAARARRRRRRGLALDLGQHPRLERDAGRRDVVGQGVQGLHLHRRHDPRHGRLLAHHLRGRRLPACGRRTRPAGHRRRQASSRTSPRSRSSAARRPAARPSRHRRPVRPRPGSAPPASLTFQDKALRPKVHRDRDRLAHDRGARHASPAGPPSMASPACRSSSRSRTSARRQTPSASSSADGYAAAGVLTKGNIVVTAASRLRNRQMGDSRMKKGSIAALAAVVLAGLAGAGPPARPARRARAVRRRARRRAGRRGLRGDRDGGRGQRRSVAAGGTVANDLSKQIGVLVVESSSATFASALSSSALVETVGKDKKFKGLPDGGPEQTADPLEPLQWDMAMIRAPEAHDLQAGSRSVDVGILDSGIDGRHPDFLVDGLGARTSTAPVAATPSASCRAGRVSAAPIRAPTTSSTARTSQERSPRRRTGSASSASRRT